MNELKRNVNSIIRELVRDLMNELREAQESNRGVDLTNFSDKIAEKYDQLDGYFLLAKERFHKSKKKFWGD